MEMFVDETDVSPELTKGTVGMATTSTTGEMAELQQALQAAQMTDTDTMSKPNTKGNGYIMYFLVLSTGFGVGEMQKMWRIRHFVIVYQIPS